MNKYGGLVWATSTLARRRCSSCVSDYSRDLHTSFAHQLSQQEIPLPVLYGMVLSLCHLGGKASDGRSEMAVVLAAAELWLQSIGETLLPRMAHFSDYIQSLFESSLPSGQQNALRVYSVLLVSERFLGWLGWVQCATSFSRQSPLSVPKQTNTHSASFGEQALLSFQSTACSCKHASFW